MENATFGMTDGMASGRFAGTANLQFGGVNSAGQPVVFADNIFSATGTAGASEQFIKDLAHWYKVTNNQASAEQQFGQGGLLNWREIPETAYVMAPPQPKDGETTQIVDVSNGPIELNEQTVEQLVMMTDKDNIPDSWHWPNNSVPNVPADGQWPKGTKFEWLNDSGQGSKLTLNKAGEKATGQIKVTLPSGSSYTIPNITVVSKANVITKSETIDFGTKLTAEDLVTNTSAFPEGTTFQFVGGEPDWNKPGNYMDVAITATYTGPDGKPITTQVSHSNVAINDSRTINILEGTTMPSADQILSLPSDWASHTIQWTDEVTDSTKSREGEITVHYNDSGLDQTIKVYVNVLPKTTPINGLDFYTNGKQIVDTSTASTITDGSIFSNAHNNAVDYEGYDKVTTTPGQPSNHPFGILNYKPSYEVTGLAKNADGSYVSGEQVATVRVYVPEVKSGPMYGFQHDDKGYYYTIQPKLNVAQKVQFEFIDTDNNDAVIGDVHSQEFIPGKNTPLDFSMKMPDHYELVPGNSIPNPYTLPAFTNDQVVVKIPIRQRMHFTISYVDDDTLENGKPKVLYSTDLQDLNNDGYSVFDLNLPGGTGNYYSVSADGVPAESTVAGLYWVPFTDSNCTFSVPNYRWNDQRTLLGANVIVHLKHKVNTVTQNEQRSATVHYVYGNGSNAGQAADQASTAAFYFTREKTHDEVTGQDTYTDWKFDDKFNNENFKNGIQAQTGTWTYDNGQVKVTLPPVDGYTVFTSGDWTDNTNAMSFNLSNKDTLTAAASDYQQKNDHAVYFVAAEEETRTITEYYKAVNDDGTPGEEIYSPSQLDVYFKKGPTEFATNGQTDPNKFSIEFAKDWSTKYDPNDSKEFKVVSGSWITGATPRNWFPAINGYQVKNIVTVDGYYDASVFSLNGNMNIVFTDKGTGEFAKSQTLYYVKNSQLQQDRTRTIEVYVPGKDASETDAEEISLTRSFNAISNNKGVQFTDWDTGSWNESNAGGEVPGYDRIIKVSIDNGQTWQSGTVADLSKVNVTDETKNMLVKVTYTATATADLSGNEQKTYTGKEFTLDDYGLQLNVTGPTAGKEAYKLRPGDIEFLADGETSWTNNLPKNVGTYKIRLTKSGIRNIEAYYGNNSIVWTKDGQSTIGGEAVFKVVQADATADLNDTSSKIYNDQPVKIEEINKVDFNARLGQPVIKQAQKSDYYRQSLDSSNQLPKTGNEEHNIIVYAGLALFGFTSILALFKKRHI